MLLKRRRKLKHLNAWDWFNFSILTFFSIVAILPIVYIMNHAFKPLSELFLYPPRFFVKSPTFQNFYDLLFAVKLSVVPISRFVFNSFVVTLATIILTVAFSAAGAYALSKMEFPGKKILFKIILLSLMFSPEAVGITRYLIVSKIGIINTYMGHILPHIALPVGVFLIKQFMDQVPKSLSEAAKIDGAGEWDVFAKIVIPSVKPAIGTTVVLAFQGVWMDQGTSVMYMLDESMKTLPYFVHTLTSGLSSSVARQGASAAAGMLMFLPNFIIFVIMKKSMMNTMVNSGIK